VSPLGPPLPALRRKALSVVRAVLPAVCTMLWALLRRVAGHRLASALVVPGVVALRVQRQHWRRGRGA